MAKSIEDMEDYLEEMEWKLDVKFNALQNFTLGKLKSVNVDLESLEKRVTAIELNDSKVDIQEELNKIDNSIGNLRSDMETVKSFGASRSPLSDGPQDYGRKHKSTTTEDTHKKKFCGFSFSPLSSPSNAARQPEVKVPQTLTDIEDSKLKNSLKPYYVDSDKSSGKLTPVQSAYFDFIMFDRFNGYTARRSAIEEVVMSGENDGLWPRGYQPEGIKNQFKDYLRERAKNCQKKKLDKEAMEEFGNKYSNL